MIRAPGLLHIRLVFIRNPIRRGSRFFGDYLIKEYPKIVGTMIYIAITACPDVAYTVGKLSRGMHKPNKPHCDRLKDAVGYLRSTIFLPLHYTRKPSKISFLFAELN